MLRTARLLFSLLLVASGFLLIASSPVHASPPSTDTHIYTQQVLLDLSSALTCQLVGIDPSGLDPQTGQPKNV